MSKSTFYSFETKLLLLPVEIFKSTHHTPRGLHLFAGLVHGTNQGAGLAVNLCRTLGLAAHRRGLGQGRKDGNVFFGVALARNALSNLGLDGILVSSARHQHVPGLGPGTRVLKFSSLDPAHNLTGPPMKEIGNVHVRIKGQELSMMMLNSTTATAASTLEIKKIQKG